MQADEEAALLKAAAADPVSEAEEEADKDSDASSESGFGLKMQKGKDKDKDSKDKKKRRASVIPKGQPNAKRAANATGTGASPKPAAKPGSDVSKLLGQAKACVTALKQFTALGFWNGTVKPKDIDKRLSTSFSVSTALEEHSQNVDAQEILVELTQVAQDVTSWVDALCPLTECEEPAATVQCARFMDSTCLAKFAQFPADALHAILVDVGRAFFQAGAE